MFFVNVILSNKKENERKLDKGIPFKGVDIVSGNVPGEG